MGCPILVSGYLLAYSRGDEATAKPEGRTGPR